MINQHRKGACFMISLIRKKSTFALLLVVFSTSAFAYQSINHQVTDSITVTNVKVLSDAPAIAMGDLYQQVQGCQLTSQINNPVIVKSNSHGVTANLEPGKPIIVPCTTLPTSLEQYNSGQYVQFFHDQPEDLLAQATTTEGITLIYDQDNARASIQ
jgi:hypothetical protein